MFFKYSYIGVHIILFLTNICFPFVLARGPPENCTFIQDAPKAEHFTLHRQLLSDSLGGNAKTLVLGLAAVPIDISWWMILLQQLMYSNYMPLVHASKRIPSCAFFKIVPRMISNVTKNGLKFGESTVWIRCS